MSRLFYHVMQDNLGNLLFDVVGTVRLAGTGTVATIYGDAALTVPIANPMTNHPSFGSFKCYLDAGNYDFYMAKAGYTFETLTGMQGWGTMALQNANLVAITGGTAGFSTLTVSGPIGIHTAPIASVVLSVAHNKTIPEHGLVIGATGGDTGAYEILFNNSSGVIVGGISTTASATTYNTTSDARLKHAIAPLAGALDVVRALNPVSFLWKADDAPGRGFLAHEVQQMVPEAVTGAAGAVREDGGIDPQGVDFSKLVPYLVSAVKELTQQVERLTAKLAGAGA